MTQRADRVGTLDRAEISIPRWSSIAESLRAAGPGIAGWVFPFAIVVYLGLRGGGYDAVVRSEVGIAIWWIVLLGAAVGILPTTTLGRYGWIGLGFLAAFALWTTFGISWSESSERSVTEAARVATYLGVFVLALTSRRPGQLRLTVNAVATALAVLAGVALLSRLHPAWFSANEATRAVSEDRLSYPVNYWNGLAALMGMAIPLLLGVVVQARSIAGRALATAAIPAVALTAFYTLSRGGAIEIAVGLAVLFALAPRRLALLVNIALAAIGSAILVAAATQRNELSDGLTNATAHQQGNEMLAITLVVCGGVALIQVALGLAARYDLGPRLAVTRRTTTRIATAAALLLLAIFLAAGGPGYLSDRWDDFKYGGGAGSGAGRFESTNGNGRYQYWQSSLDANATAPLTGIGPGGFESWWAREGDLPGFIRDAHSLYFETLGEAGIVGFLLIVGFIGTVLVVGAGRSVRGDPERRWPYAVATSSAAVFAIAAGLDWAWELAVLPIGFVLLAAGLLGDREYQPPVGRERTLMRAGLAGLAVVAAVWIAIPMLGTESVRDSQREAQAGNLEAALDDAQHAHSLQPYAASPQLQEALVLELMGDLDKAALAARNATTAESTNWRTWLVLSRIEAERGRAEESVDAYRRARSLNPRSPLFSTS